MGHADKEGQSLDSEKEKIGRQLTPNSRYED